MRTHRSVVAALVALLLGGGAAPVVAGPVELVDRSVTAVEWGAGAECRRLSSDADDEQCAAVDGRTVSGARVAAYQATWVHRALALQRSFDDDVPLTEALLPHTHNSFNSSSYDPTLTNQDPNQVYSLTDQLDMDIRALELDVHWVPSRSGTPDTGGYWPTLCHGTSDNPAQVHVGCSVDRPLDDGLREIATWLDAHPDELVLLYLENQLDGDPLAHRVAGDVLEREIGDLVYRPPATAPCAAMDWGVSESSVRATGARIVVVGNCDGAVAGDTAWGASVHERGPRWDESGDPSTYSAAECAADRAARLAAGGGPFRRYFEDSTWVSAAVGGTSAISAEAAAAMARCGVNLVGFDQLTPDDPRLAALVWSWAPDEPAPTGACGYQGTDTRFHAGDCAAPRPAACIDGAGNWRVTIRSVAWAEAAAECSTLGATFAVPANGLRNALLAETKPSPEVWVHTST